MSPQFWMHTSLLPLLGVLAACSPSSGDDIFGNGTGGGSGGTAGAGGDVGQDGPAAGSGGTSGPVFDAAISNETGSGGGVSSCQTDPDEDADHDGYSVNEGDCNDCDPNANPGAFDVVGGVNGGPGVDEDCDGEIDNEPTGCDQGFDIADTDPMNAAKAIGLCRTADPNAVGKDRTWGVLAARYVKVDGTPGMNPLSHGLLPRFGAAGVQEGLTLLALSSGTARAPNHPGFESPNNATMGTFSNPPAGYPKESPSCPGVITGDCNDPAALEVDIRVPTNAQSFGFNLNFYTFEFPAFICSEYNDFYVTMLSPPPPGQPDGNISFDQDSNPISVNNSLLQVCESQEAGGMGKFFPCPLGMGLLDSTGFEGHAATGWLQTVAPVTPGSVITLRFAIWDSGDEILDSTVLIDNFLWSLEAATEAETKPVQVPK